MSAKKVDALQAFLVEVNDSGLDSAVEVIGITKSLVGEEMLLEIAPGVFNGVQFGCVLRQPFDRQPGPGLEGGLGYLAGMDGTVVDNEDDRSCPLARGVAFLEPPEQRDEVGAALAASTNAAATRHD